MIKHEHEILGDGTTFHCTSCAYWKCMRHADIGKPYITGDNKAGCTYCKKLREQKKHEKR